MKPQLLIFGMLTMKNRLAKGVIIAILAVVKSVAQNTDGLDIAERN